MESYTKWLDVQVIPNTGVNSKSVIKVLRRPFYTFGLAVKFVSDKGTSFTSHEFRDFLKPNGMKQILNPPYCQSSNAQAESFLQTVKNYLKARER